MGASRLLELPLREHEEAVLPEFILRRIHPFLGGCQTISALRASPDLHPGPWSSLSWTFRISSGVSKGIHRSVVQGDGEFLRFGVAGRQWETF